MIKIWIEVKEKLIIGVWCAYKAIATARAQAQVKLNESLGSLLRLKTPFPYSKGERERSGKDKYV